MEPSKLLDAHVQARRMYHLLGEVMDLSRQLAQALDRGDEITVRMLLSMRAEPIQKLEQVRNALNQQVVKLGQEDGLHMALLLQGEPPAGPEEEPLAEQVTVNRRLWQQVVELDRRISLSLSREKSPYQP